MTEVGLAQTLTQAGQTRGQHLGRGRKVLDGHSGLQVFADLAAQGRGLAHEIAAVADEELEFQPRLLLGGLQEGKAGDGGALDGRQVGVIGLIAWVLGLAKLLGGEGMDDACLQACRREGALHDPVVTAGALDGDQEIVHLVPHLRLLELGDGQVQGTAVMGDLGGRHEDIAEEIAKHPLGARLGTIDADNAEMFRPDLLDARVDEAAGLLQDVGATGASTLTGSWSGMGTYLQKEKEEYPNSLRRQSSMFFFL
jgi:hypothetical protein